MKPNLLMFLSTKGHLGQYRMYRSTLTHLIAQCGGSLDNVFGDKILNLKAFAGDDERVNSILKYFSNLAFSVILHEDDDPTVNDSTPQTSRQSYIIGRILNDLRKTFQQLEGSPYTFLLEDDSPIMVKSEKSLDWFIEKSITELNLNPDLSSIHFARLMVNGKKVSTNAFYTYHNLKVEDGLIKNGYWFNFQPRVHRTRDLRCVGQVIDKNWSYFSTRCPENGMMQALQSLGLNQFWAFPIEDAYSLHLGEQNGGTIDDDESGRVESV